SCGRVPLTRPSLACRGLTGYCLSCCRLARSGCTGHSLIRCGLIRCGRRRGSCSGICGCGGCFITEAQFLKDIVEKTHGVLLVVTSARAYCPMQEGSAEIWCGSVSILHA